MVGSASVGRGASAVAVLAGRERAGHTASNGLLRAGRSAGLCSGGRMSGGAVSGGGVVPPPFETQAGVPVGENFGSALASADADRDATGGRCVTTCGIGRSGSAGGGA